MNISRLDEHMEKRVEEVIKSNWGVYTDLEISIRAFTFTMSAYNIAKKLGLLDGIKKNKSVDEICFELSKRSKDGKASIYDVAKECGSTPTTIYVSRKLYSERTREVIKVDKSLVKYMNDQSSGARYTELYGDATTTTDLLDYAVKHDSKLSKMLGSKLSMEYIDALYSVYDRLIIEFDSTPLMFTQSSIVIISGKSDLLPSRTDILNFMINYIQEHNQEFNLDELCNMFRYHKSVLRTALCKVKVVNAVKTKTRVCKANDVIAYVKRNPSKCTVDDLMLKFDISRSSIYRLISTNQIAHRDVLASRRWKLGVTQTKVKEFLEKNPGMYSRQQLRTLFVTSADQLHSLFVKCPELVDLLSTARSTRTKRKESLLSLIRESERTLSIMMKHNWVFSPELRVDLGCDDKVLIGFISANNLWSRFNMTPTHDNMYTKNIDVVLSRLSDIKPHQVHQLCNTNNNDTWIAAGVIYAILSNYNYKEHLKYFTKYLDNDYSEEIKTLEKIATNEMDKYTCTELASIVRMPTRMVVSHIKSIGLMDRTLRRSACRNDALTIHRRCNTFDSEYYRDLDYNPIIIEETLEALRKCKIIRYPSKRTAEEVRAEHIANMNAKLAKIYDDAKLLNTLVENPTIYNTHDICEISGWKVRTLNRFLKEQNLTSLIKKDVVFEEADEEYCNMLINLMGIKTYADMLNSLKAFNLTLKLSTYNKLVSKGR